MRTTIVNGTLLDTDSMTMVGERHLTLEGGVIVDVDESRPTAAAAADADPSLDAGGPFFFPRVLDAPIPHMVPNTDL
ncbi:MAG: hypothetical protein ACR2QK_06770, partial [Acidimicrobiales bacterium]